MFDEPMEDPAEPTLNPADRAREKADEFRVHAQLAAVFEGVRKFDARIIPGLNPETARDIQRTMGRLEKAKPADTPILPKESTTDAAGLLNLPKTRDLSTNDYHVHRRPGEVMIVRWLAGEEVEKFYERLQAHFDAALSGFIEDERANEWKLDEKAQAFLTALESVKVNMAERLLRDPIRKLNIFVLSTQTADEINISYLCDHIMGVSAAELVGEQSAPPDEPSESDLAWFFKLFALRGMRDGVEQMCFFTFMQK